MQENVLSSTYQGDKTLAILVHIGALLFSIAGLINLLVCSIAAVIARNGQTSRYPITIRFLKG